MSKTKTATAVEPKDHPRDDHQEAPFKRNRCGKRRSATKPTMAGVMNSETNNRHETMTTGVANTTSIRGAKTVRKSPKPSTASHDKRACSSEADCRPSLKAKTASSQNQ